MNRYVRNMWQSIIDFVFPPRKDEKNVGRVCAEDIMLLPRANYIDEQTYALFAYNDQRIRSLIWELKYHKNKQVCQYIAPFLGDIITEEVREKELFANWHTVYLVPVPMTTKRQRQRGYSQLELLCSYLIEYLPSSIIYDPTLLQKTRETTAQNKTRTRQERLENLVGSIRAKKNLSLSQIILIDDVTTTGATLAECRRALVSAGVREKDIIAFTIAH